MKDSGPRWPWLILMEEKSIIFGFPLPISAPLSWPFCGSCNRLRLAVDGKIRTCLFSRDEIDVKTPLRRGADRHELMAIIRNAVTGKPRRHELDRLSCKPAYDRTMYAIGG